MHHATKLIVSAAAAFALVATLSSCSASSTTAKPTGTAVGSTAPASIPKATPGTSTSPSSPTQPAPSTTAINPTDPSTWVITFTGIGPLTIGGDKAAQIAKVTTYSEHGGPTTCPAKFLTAAKGPTLIVADYTTPGRNDVLSVAGVIGASSPATAYGRFSPATDKGIRLGSTLAQLKSAYPGIANTGSYGPDWTYYGLASGTHHMNFTVHSGVVDSIELSSAKTPRSEYCG